MSKEQKIPFIAHSENIDLSKHLNESKLNWHQQQKIGLYTSVNVNSERKGHIFETRDMNFCWKNNFTRRTQQSDTKKP